MLVFLIYINTKLNYIKKNILTTVYLQHIFHSNLHGSHQNFETENHKSEKVVKVGGCRSTSKNANYVVVGWRPFLNLVSAFSTYNNESPIYVNIINIFGFNSRSLWSILDWYILMVFRSYTK